MKKVQITTGINDNPFLNSSKSVSDVQKEIDNTVKPLSPPFQLREKKEPLHRLMFDENIY